MADKNDERRFPLQQVDVDTLSLHWIRSQRDSKALERFNTALDVAQQPANVRTGEREHLLRVLERDAQDMKKAGIIQTHQSYPLPGG
ncbi:hypothetical protein DQ04_09651030 [Trypanosoma grayi]|uniref:hypothetical protein n=1 Tax=Trypanosoma grayi TaxID=71804 RepID=UPI0004F42E8D|nr:hypothetical protein DQ04_09651030 [Trypanosoma grayi]KEG07488.1 hypothetical protein DQ04_09651030 [Trypanosoma grayi]